MVALSAKSTGRRDSNRELLIELHATYQVMEEAMTLVTTPKTTISYIIDDQLSTIQYKFKFSTSPFEFLLWPLQIAPVYMYA